MPTNKEIRIRAVLDQSEFDQQINRIEQKMSQMQKKSEVYGQAQQNYGVGSKMGEYTRAFFGDYNKESIDNLREVFNLNTRKMQHESREMRNKERELKSLEKLEDNMSKAQAEKVKSLKEEIDLIKQRGQELIRQNNAMRERAVGMGSDLSGWKGGDAPEQTLSDPTGLIYNQRMRNYRDLRRLGVGRGLSRGLSAFGGGGLLSAATGAVAFGGMAQVGVSAADEYAEKQRNLAVAQGSAMRMATIPIQEQMQNRGMENQIFARERLGGFQISREEMASKRARDLLRSSAAPQGLMTGIGTAGATAAGAAIGTAIFPGIGTAIGGGLGYLSGNVLGGALTNKDVRGAMFNTEEYRSKLTEEGLKKQQQVEAAEKLKNFQKTMAYEEYSKNMENYRNFQRQFGIANVTSPQSLLGQFNQAGLRRETAMQLGGQMMGAAGMTTNEGDVQDLRRIQLLREAGITNAATVGGRIKGLEKSFGVGGQNQEKVLEKILYDAQKAAINDSKMVEETRNFLNVTTQIATQAGVSAGTISEELARGGAADTIIGLKAAQTAFQMREQESGRLSGTQGAFKWAFAGSGRGKELLGGMSGNFELTSSFLGMPISQMDENNPLVQRFMQEMGVDNIEELRRRKREFELRGSTLRGETVKKIKSLGEKTEGMGGKDFIKATSRGGDLFKDYTDIVSRLQVERGETGRRYTPEQIRQYIRSVGNVGTQPSQEGALPMERPIPTQAGALDEMWSEMGLGAEGGEPQYPYKRTRPSKPSMLEQFVSRGARAPGIAKEASEAADQLANMARLDTYIDGFSKAANKNAEITKKLGTTTNDVDKAMELFRDAIKGGTESLKILQDIIMKVQQGDYEGVQNIVDEMNRQSSKSESPQTSGSTGRRW